MNQSNLRILNLSSRDLTPEEIANGGVEMDKNLRQLVVLQTEFTDMIDAAATVRNLVRNYECNAVYMDIETKMYRDILFSILFYVGILGIELPQLKEGTSNE